MSNVIEIRQNVDYQRFGLEAYFTTHFFGSSKFSAQFKLGTGFYPGYFNSYRDASFVRVAVSIGIGNFLQNK
jgi:hypothetical protein